MFELAIILPSSTDNLMHSLRSDSELLYFTFRRLSTNMSLVFSTVWIYLFFLPFQLIEQFAWSTIPGVGIAAFIYLGFIPVSSFCLLQYSFFDVRFPRRFRPHIISVYVVRCSFFL